MKKSVLILILSCSLISCNQDRLHNYVNDYVEYQIEKEPLKSNLVELSMIAGVLKIESTDQKIMEGKFYYPTDKWRPKFDYENENGSGRLHIFQEKKISFKDDFDGDNDWQVAFNRDVPLDLLVNFSAGEADIDLSEMNLQKVTLKTGAGEFDINLSDTSVPELYLNTGVGEVRLDLSGGWKNDHYSKINAGVGELRLTIPSETGVQIKANGLLGDIDHNLRKEGEYLVNEALGKTRFHLSIEIKAGIGQIVINEE